MSNMPTLAEELPESGAIQLPDVGLLTESADLLPTVSDWAADGLIVGDRLESVFSVVSVSVSGSSV